MDKLSRLFNGLGQKRAMRKRLKQRKIVEQQYAKDHPQKITVVKPEYDKEFKLTHNGRFELGSNGKLTQKGLIDRLKYRLNRAIIIVIFLTILLYLYFIFF